VDTHAFGRSISMRGVSAPISMNPIFISIKEIDIDSKIKAIGLSAYIEKKNGETKLKIRSESITTSNATLTDEVIITKPILIDAMMIGDYKNVEANIELHKTKFILSTDKTDGEINFVLYMNKTPCQDIIDSIPQGMKSTIDGMESKGEMSWELHGSTREKAYPSIELKLNNTCKIIKAPDALLVAKLRKPFKRVVFDKDKNPIEVMSGPKTDGWTPVGLTSQFVPMAFRTMEDPSFLAHHGFDIQAIENSIKENIKYKKFLRGASTITMQLSKNLWLNRDKTLSRKIQEAFLTMYLEQSLTKDEILELYMNVVEFGPNIYGIGKASKYYFNKFPTDLTLGQSLFLASVLPNPKAGFFDANGNLSPRKAEHLKVTMKAMMERKLISQDEYNDGVKEVLKFKQASTSIEEPIEVDTSAESWQTN
jgi:hypothetical protein